MPVQITTYVVWLFQCHQINLSFVFVCGFVFFFGGGSGEDSLLTEAQVLFILIKSYHLSSILLATHAWADNNICGVTFSMLGISKMISASHCNAPPGNHRISSNQYHYYTQDLKGLKKKLLEKKRIKIYILAFIFHGFVLFLKESFVISACYLYAVLQ